MSRTHVIGIGEKSSHRPIWQLAGALARVRDALLIRLDNLLTDNVMGDLTRVRLLSIVLRGATLAGKSLLIFFLAKFLEPTYLGIYGLLMATIGYSLYLVGLDFYVFTTREVLKRKRHEWGGLIKDQGALALAFYLVIAPLLSVIFIKGILPWTLVGWFFALLVIEHVNQEMGRFLIAISEQLTASVILFLRQGAWAIVVTALMVVEQSARSLNCVLGAWAIAGILAILVGVYRVRRLSIGGWCNKIDWAWLAAGLKVSSLFLLATLAIRGVFALDRYWVQALAGIEVVGAYVLFMGLASVLMAFLDAGVFSFIYPSMISAFQKKQRSLFHRNIRRLLIQTLIVSLAFAALTLTLLPTLLSWVNNPIYTAQQNLYSWLLLATIVYAFSMVPHYALYAQGLDRPIIQSHIAGFLLFVLSTWIFSWNWRLLAVPLGLIAAFLLVLIWKALAFFWFTRSKNNFEKT